MINLELGTGLIGATILHLSLFAFASISSPPKIDFNNGPSTIEVNLVSPMEIRQKEVDTVIQNVRSEPEELIVPEKIDELPGNKQFEIEVQDEAIMENNVISQESQSIPWVEPHYLVNPPPVYPARALLRGWQGQVVLFVEIDSEGQPTAVEVEESSGHGILDHAAVRAVNTWVFVPANRQNTAVPSRSRVPVRFLIKG